MPTPLETQAGELQAKRQELAAIFEKATVTVDGKSTYDLTAEQIDDVRKRNVELDELGKKHAVARDLDALDRKNRDELEILNTPVHPSSHGGGRERHQDAPAVERKTLGQRVLESPEAKRIFADVKGGGQFRPFRVEIPDFDTKTVMAETGSGFAPPNYRTNIVIFSAQRRPVVADLIPQDPTDKEAIKYMEETTFTNSAAMTAEGASAPESALAYTERTVLVEWLPTTLPVTEQQLEDVPQLNGIINNRLTLQIQLAEETQLLTGTGTSPQLKSFLGSSLSGLNTQATGSDPAPDAILKGMTLVRFTGFANPSGCIMHPNNWQAIRLLRTTTGAYLFGNPSEAGVAMLWGMPVVVTPVITQDTSLLGDFLMYSHISRRRGLRIEVGFVNDDFKKGQKTLRADERLSLEIYRGAAFAQVTGLPH